MGLKEKLLTIQHELKAPKNAYNSFGKYNYRSCEDILEALKPVLLKAKATLQISDTIEVIGDRYYVKATATLMDTESDERIENVAYARESDDKRGMDASQVTGATSSYARKYALNGLFLIDDTKDADTDENKKESVARQKKAPTKSEEQLNKEMAESVDKDLVPSGKPVDAQRIKRIMGELERTGVSIDTILGAYQCKDLREMTEEQYISCMNRLLKSKDRA